MPRRGGSEVVVILWRDIPAQVNAQIGRERHQVHVGPPRHRDGGYGDSERSAAQAEGAVTEKS